MMKTKSRPGRSTVCRVWPEVVAVLASLACVNYASFAAPAANAPVSASWLNLSDDSSRSALFDQIKKDRLSSDTSNGIQGFPFKGDFAFPHDAVYDDIAGKPRSPDTVFGIDVSHFSSLDLTVALLSKQHVTFTYAKATQGVRYSDGKFGQFWKMLGATNGSAKIYRGAYHFLSAGVDGAQQADRFVDYVNLQGGFKSDDMPPCVDLEWDRTSSNPDQWHGHKAKDIIDEVVAWLNEVEKRTGRVPLIYTARSWWDGVVPRGGDSQAQFNRLARYPIWVADYSRSGRFTENPAVPLGMPWQIWQFTSTSLLQSGYPDGLRLDASVHKGPVGPFLAALGVQTAAAPVAAQ